MLTICGWKQKICWRNDFYFIVTFELWYNSEQPDNIWSLNKFKSSLFPIHAMTEDLCCVYILRWWRCFVLTPQTQIQYLKQVQQPSAAQLRSSMVDPAINLFFLKMKAELEQTKDKLEQAQNELSAWKFTPDR